MRSRRLTSLDYLLNLLGLQDRLRLYSPHLELQVTYNRHINSIETLLKLRDNSLLR